MAAAKVHQNARSDTSTIECLPYSGFRQEKVRQNMQEPSFLKPVKVFPQKAKNTGADTGVQQSVWATAVSSWRTRILFQVFFLSFYF